MPERSPDTTARLFYSYSHEDAKYRVDMEKSLDLLKTQGLLHQWSDAEILPGKHLSREIRAELVQANIIVFLLSSDFIASEECRKEWAYAEGLSNDGRLLFRIPIILRDCTWKDMLGEDDVKALPNDGKAVARYASKDAAWLEVYEGIKAVVNELRQTFTPKEEFLREIEDTEFISSDRIKLEDSFVFPRMTRNELKASDQPQSTTTISDQEQLLNIKYSLIHGQEKAGKTALARYLYLSLVAESKPVLLVDLSHSGVTPKESFLENTYHSQFLGDYSLWAQQGNKTLILDNMTSDRRALELITLARTIFERIVITLPSDAFYAYFMDDARLADFEELKIEPLTRGQQERLIRKRLALSEVGQVVSDGLIDQMEADVNSIIVSNKIVPRYPFYVLSILQSRERYMPDNISITSYGHCYYVLIISNLFRAGIAKEDKDVNTCFNFAEHLAFAIYRNSLQESTPFDYGAFRAEYEARFYIQKATINRLSNRDYGIIDKRGSFKREYMYYYFLGKFLSGNSEAGKEIVSEMCENSHVDANYLTLLFTIHHSRDNIIIDDILLRTMCALDSVGPATLVPEETKRFQDITAALPQNILSKDTVSENRGKERAIQEDIHNTEMDASATTLEGPEMDRAIGVYRILKHNKIMAQVLRNKHGNLEKAKVEEIVETIADSGLRLINVVLHNEEGRVHWMRFIKSKRPDINSQEIRRTLDILSFLWTIVNVESIVECINVPEIREAVDAVVSRNGTPAYDLVGYFSLLDSAKILSQRQVDGLDDVLKKHGDMFVQHIVRLRTQQYMNTHRSPAPIEQAICIRLNIPYFVRALAGA